MFLLRMPFTWFGRWWETRSILRDAHTMGSLLDSDWTIEGSDEW